MAKRVRPFEELPDDYVEQRLLFRRAVAAVKREPGSESDEEDDDDDDDDDEEEEEEEEDEENESDEREEKEDGSKRLAGKPVSSTLFAHAVAINGEAEFLEQRVRSMAAAMAARLPDDDPVFAVPFAENNSEDRLRYCTAMIPLLLERIAKKKK
jgi:ABC-type Zn2+ transport system substrate-binding protein/surface adhesin